MVSLKLITCISKSRKSIKLSNTLCTNRKKIINTEDGIFYQDINGVSRSRKPKDRQYNDKQKRDKQLST